MVFEREIDEVSLRSAWLHQARLRSRLHVAHFAVELGPRHQRRHRIDHQYVDRARAHQGVGDLQRLFAGVGLRDQEVVDVDAEFARIGGVQRVFRVDEGASAAALLRLGNGMQRERGLARGFRSVNFDHPPARQAADAERDVEAQRARGNGVDIDLVALAEGA